MNRRSFLKGILAAGIAPAFIGSSVLMPTRKLWMPRTTPILYGDGVHDDMIDALTWSLINSRGMRNGGICLPPNRNFFIGDVAKFV